MSTVDAAETWTEVAARIMRRCDELAEISASDEGILRAYLTEEHRRHDELAAEWMAEAGMVTWQDAAGNRCGRLEGREEGLPALVLGSHLDTVPDAGRYDGILGVLSAVEVVRALRGRREQLPFALEVVAFADEEGTRFGRTLLGSRAWAGTWDSSWWDVADADGVTLREAFGSFGLDPERVGDAARRPEELVGYLELHIEQGPQLEAADRALGVVTSIAGARRFHLTVHGEARHAGGTPYERRRDALVGAGGTVLDVEEVGRELGVIATVGQMRAFPGGVNVVPGRAELSLDLRAPADALRDQAWGTILRRVEERCVERGLRVEAEEIHSAPTVDFAPELMEAVRAGIGRVGDHEPLEMWSRAGHDAMAVAETTGTAMLFVRCVDGISHHPDEEVSTPDVAAGVEAFAAVVEDLAARGTAAGGALAAGDVAGSGLTS